MAEICLCGSNSCINEGNAEEYCYAWQSCGLFSEYKNPSMITDRLTKKNKYEFKTKFNFVIKNRIKDEGNGTNV